MAALSITAANVLQGAGAKRVEKAAGATLTAGLAVYSDNTDNGSAKAASNTSATLANCIGIALNSAADGQPVYVHTEGLLAGMGATKGIVYVVGATGAIEPVADQTIGDYVTVLGVGTSTGAIDVKIIVSGQVL